MCLFTLSITVNAYELSKLDQFYSGRAATKYLFSFVIFYRLLRTVILFAAGICFDISQNFLFVVLYNF